MKRSKIEPGQSEFLCDNEHHHGEEHPAYGQLTIHFWYGSEFDMKQGALHLCDECSKDIMFLIKKEFGTKKFLNPIIEL